MKAFRPFRFNQRGTTTFVIALAIFLLAVVAFAGYRVVRSSKSNSSNSSAVSSAKAASPPAEIKSKADVQQAVQALDNDQTANQLNPDQLNSDLNSLL